jgi:predicted nucleic acid-binding Zn ribbon protein
MRKASEVLSALFREKFDKEFLETARSSAGLFSSWSQIVENIPEAADHSRVRELEKGQLLIEVDHPGWIHILKIKQQELLSGAKRKYPELDIRSIAFKLSRKPF